MKLYDIFNIDDLDLYKLSSRLRLCEDWRDVISALRDPSSKKYDVEAITGVDKWDDMCVEAQGVWGRYLLVG